MLLESSGRWPLWTAWGSRKSVVPCIHPASIEFLFEVCSLLLEDLAILILRKQNWNKNEKEPHSHLRNSYPWGPKSYLYGHPQHSVNCMSRYIHTIATASFTELSIFLNVPMNYIPFLHFFFLFFPSPSNLFYKLHPSSSVQINSSPWLLLFQKHFPVTSSSSQIPDKT